jgi:hypothetical protein
MPGLESLFIPERIKMKTNGENFIYWTNFGKKIWTKFGKGDKFWHNWDGRGDKLQQGWTNLERIHIKNG